MAQFYFGAPVNQHAPNHSCAAETTKWNVAVNNEVITPASHICPPRVKSIVVCLCTCGLRLAVNR